jgi:IS30 family transposase
MTMAWKMLIWDRGCEVVCHDLLAEYFTDGVFAHPAGPDCAARTRTPRLLRQHFPKGISTNARSRTYGRSSNGSLEGPSTRR